MNNEELIKENILLNEELEKTKNELIETKEHLKKYNLLKQQIKTKFTEELVNDTLNSFKSIDILKLVDTYNKQIDNFVKNNKCEEIEEFIEDLVWDALNNLAFEKECERQDAYEKVLYKEK